MHALAITEQGTRVHLEAETLLVQRGQQTLRRVRLGEIDQLLLFGQVELTAAAVATLARRPVDVVFLTQHGTFRARLVGPRSPQAALRLAQLRRAAEPAFCLRLAAAFVAGKVTHQRQVLLRGQRRLRDEALAGVLGRLRLLIEGLPGQTDLDRLRGQEGQAAALYFGQLGKLLIGSDLTFGGRNRRPPRDPVNACLSFGYSLLGTVVEAEVLRRGLEPPVGFFHQPLHNRASLALDVLEEFRPFVDTLVLRLVNRRQLGPADFDRRGPEPEELLAAGGERGGPEGGPDGEAGVEPVEGVYLNAAGRRVFLAEFYGRLRERLAYPPRGGSFELRDIIREQVQHLARVIDGTDEEYRAFVPG